MQNKKISARLTTPQRRLFALMQYNVDLEIKTIFKAVWPKAPYTGNSVKQMQMRIGGVISSTNHVLGFFDLRIRPGRTRGTYVLTTTIDFRSL